MSVGDPVSSIYSPRWGSLGSRPWRAHTVSALLWCRVGLDTDPDCDLRTLTISHHDHIKAGTIHGLKSKHRTIQNLQCYNLEALDGGWFLLGPFLTGKLWIKDLFYVAGVTVEMHLTFVPNITTRDCGAYTRLQWMSFECDTGPNWITVICRLFLAFISWSVQSCFQCALR